MPVNWHPESFKAKMRAAEMEAVHDAAEIMWAEAQDQVPHASGDLESHITVTDSPSELASYISATGPHAVRQHEDETLQHPDPINPESRSGRKAHYIEDPVKQHHDDLKRLVEARCKAALK